MSKSEPVILKDVCVQIGISFCGLSMLV
jgi:hypothetical protein